MIEVIMLVVLLAVMVLIVGLQNNKNHKIITENQQKILEEMQKNQ